MMIIATLKRDWEMLDGGGSNRDQKVMVPAGTHELERIANPHGHENYWLVLKGTKIGMAEGAWKQWINGVLANVKGHKNFGKPIDWGENEIILEEDGKVVPPQD